MRSPRYRSPSYNYSSSSRSRSPSYRSPSYNYSSSSRSPSPSYRSPSDSNSSSRSRSPSSHRRRRSPKPENNEKPTFEDRKEAINLMVTNDDKQDNNNNNNNNNSPNIRSPKSFSDFGGIDGVIDRLNTEVIVPLFHPHVWRHLGGVKPVTRILLHGPPGCGKSNLARALANEAGLPLYHVNATELVSRTHSGPSVRDVADLFTKAYNTAPSIVFIDEIDAIASNRANSQMGSTESRSILEKLIKCMDDPSHLARTSSDYDDRMDSRFSDIDNKNGYVLVIGATNRADAMDPQLRMPGRFDREIVIGLPDKRARLEILSKMTSNIKVGGALDLAKIASSTWGFVGADLLAVVDEACKLAWKRVLDKRKVELSERKINVSDWRKHPWSVQDINNLTITMADFMEAVNKTAERTSFIRQLGVFDVPNVKWDDIGGVESRIRKDFDRYIIRRIKFPEIYEGLRLRMPKTFLLYGPSGSGMTMIAKAVANEAGANFIHIKASEFLDKHGDESELAMETIFSRARTCSPCIIFFDEVDALTTTYGKQPRSVVQQLLLPLDCGKERKGVYVIGATRRFEKLVYVPPPNPDERGMILKFLAHKSIDATNVDLMALGKRACNNFTAADLSSLMHEAIMESIDDQQVSPLPRTVRDVHFKRALENVSPSVSYEQIERYKQLSKRLKVARE